MMMVHPLAVLASIFMWLPCAEHDTEPSVLPYNARQIEGGYWVGGRPSVSNVPALRKAGITKVVSLVKLDDRTIEALKAEGIRQVHLTFGTKFPSPGRVDKALGETAPEHLYLHCRFGADRVGVFLAYLLATRQGWDIPSAFLSVVRTGDRWGDEEQLRTLLEEAGYDTSKVGMGVPGVFSAMQNGGDGGLKLSHENYQRMVRKTIARIREARRR